MPDRETYPERYATRLGGRPPAGRLPAIQRPASPLALRYAPGDRGALVGVRDMPTSLAGACSVHGRADGEMPASAEEREQMMAAFRAWAASTGDRMIDPGAPPGPSKVVTSDTVTDGAADGRIGGYTVLRAESPDDAVQAVQDHPFLGRGGTLPVSQAVSP